MKALINSYRTAMDRDVVVSPYLLVASLIQEGPELFALDETIEGNPTTITEELLSHLHDIAFDEQYKALGLPIVYWGANKLSPDMTKKDLYDVLVRHQGVQDILKSYGIAVDTALQGNLLDMLSEKLEPKYLVEDEKAVFTCLEILGATEIGNIYITGVPGVGKTSVGAMLYKRFKDGNIPVSIKDKKYYYINAVSLTDPKVFSLFIESLNDQNNCIIFIDDADLLIDYATRIRYMLEKPGINFIFASMEEGYKKFLKKAGQLGRLFNVVKLEEPTDERMYNILNKVKVKYELKHKVEVGEKALFEIIHLASRYLQKANPAASIELLDLSSYYYDVVNTFGPSDGIKALQEKLKLDYDISRAKVYNNKVRYEKLSKKLSGNEYKEYDNSLYLGYVNEMSNLQKLEGINEKLECFAKIIKLEEKLPPRFINEDMVCTVVSDLTGIPVNKLNENDTERILKLDEALKKHVIGQPQAVNAIHKAVKRFHAGIQPADKPIGSFLFLGPTGVGKTYLAQTLAEELYNDKNALIRFDMSEYMEKFNISRLIGAPPGYVGYDKGGQLTDAIKRRPYSIVLFDEIEKAHPSIYDVLLQILDAARITDGQGDTVDFSHAIIILTSNIGSRKIMKYHGLEDKYMYMRKEVIKEVENYFKPELLNRIDSKVVFHSLNKNSVNKIIRLQLDELTERLEHKDIELSYDDKVVNYIFDHGYSPTYGARNISRTIKNDIETQLADYILTHAKQEKHSKIRLSSKHDKIVLS